MVQYWLLKSEPEEWSWEHQAMNNGISTWDGVKNAQARNNLKRMRVGDKCFFYHTGKAKEIVGIVSVVKEFYADTSDSSGKNGMVDVQAVSLLNKPVTLTQLKQQQDLNDFVLFKQPRLSVVPVTEDVWIRICQLGGSSP